MKICFVASSGGHLEQILMLQPIMKKYNSFIVTEETLYNYNIKNMLTYNVTQTNRKEIFFIFKFIKLTLQSLKIFLKERPDLIISTGALSAVPICLLAKLFRKKLIFIESFSKINSPTITGKLIYKFADLFVIQWEDLRKYYPNATYGGKIY